MAAFRLAKVLEKNKDCNIELTLHQHDPSGLRVLFSSDTKSSPLYHLSIIVPTLAHDHSGLPHTLEHLIFLGSAMYSERGYLDKLAMMGVANGTNAYTSEDHTCYTLSTASPEGLFCITPVFLDHVLRPLLREADFVGEVYDGGDRGVVYSEMRAREWSEADQLDNLLRQHLANYSNVFEAYRWECGGRTPAIKQLSMEHIRAYHQKWYTPSNVILHISGPLNHELRQGVINGITDLMRSFGSEPVRSLKPAIETAEMLNSLSSPGLQDRCVTAQFPSEDESLGSVGLIWSIGAQDEQRLKTLVGFQILGRYLRDNSGSPLAHHFTQRPDSIICTSVDWDVKWWADGALIVVFSGVNMCNKEKENRWMKPHVIYREFLHVLDEILCDIQDEKRLDKFISDIKDAMQGHMLQVSERLEEDPHEFAISYLLPELIESVHRGREFTGHLWAEMPRVLAELQNAKAAGSFLATMIRGLKELPLAGQVLMEPSRALAEKLKPEQQHQSEERPQARPLASVTGFPSIQADSSLVTDAVAHRGVRIVSCSKNVQIVSLPESSPFNHVTIGISIDHIIENKPELLPYFVLLQELFFDTDLEVKFVAGFSESLLESRRYTYTELQALLTRSFVSWGAGVGIDSGSGGSASPFVIGFHETCLVASASCSRQISPLLMINLLLNVISNSVFPDDRIVVAVEQLESSIVDSKRDSSVLYDAILMRTLLRKQPADRRAKRRRIKSSASLTIVDAFSVFTQESFLEGIDARQAASKLQELQACLQKTMLDGMFVQVASPLKIDFPIDLVKGQQAWPVKNLPRLASCFVAEGHAMIVPVRDLTASYLSITVACPELLKQPIDTQSIKEFFSVAVLCQLFSMLEGPLYRGIRGAGLAYDSSCSISVWNGLLAFTVSEGSDVTAALQVLINEVAKLEDAGLPSWLTEQDVDFARKTMLYQMVSERSSPSSILSCHLRDTLQALPIDEGSEYYMILDTIDVQSVLEAGRKFLTMLVDDKSPRITIVLCPVDDKGRLEALKQRLEKSGIPDVAIRQLSDF